MYIQLSAGNIHDSALAIEVLSEVELTGSVVLADKAYGSQNIRDYIKSQNGMSIIIRTKKIRCLP